MSDFPKGPWQDTWTALFWRFMDKHRTKLGKNPRMNMLLGTYDRMPAEQQQRIQKEASKILKKMSGNF
jgi:deoxyribodipyrimidine photolyase-related protein